MRGTRGLFDNHADRRFLHPQGTETPAPESGAASTSLTFAARWTLPKTSPVGMATIAAWPSARPTVRLIALPQSYSPKPGNFPEQHCRRFRHLPL
jgi:hypothetical protein